MQRGDTSIHVLGAYIQQQRIDHDSGSQYGTGIDQAVYSALTKVMVISQLFILGHECCSA